MRLTRKTWKAMFFLNRLLRLINHIFNAWADYGFGLGDAKFFYEFPYNFYRILSENNSIYMTTQRLPSLFWTFRILHCNGPTSIVASSAECSKKSEQNVQFPDSHWQGDRTQNSSFMNSFIVPLLIKSHNGTEKETPSLTLGICEFHQSYF